VDKSELGFGKRLMALFDAVKDGVIKKMFIEPEKPATLRGVGRRHHAELHQSQGKEARPGGHTYPRRLRLLRESEGSTQGSWLRLRRGTA